MRIITHYILGAFLLTGLASCEKLVTVDPPINSMTTGFVFDSESRAKQALSGVYSLLFQGRTQSSVTFSPGGYTTLLGSLSSDDLYCLQGDLNIFNPFSLNRVRQEDVPSKSLWITAYEIIYAANGVIEGIQASGPNLEFSEQAKNKMIGECRVIRAFCYFYLINLFGDVPLVTTVEWSKTRTLPRAPKATVYKLIVDDLIFARDNLPPVNTNSAGERVYADKWAATALLARTYLYLEEYPSAWQQADAVIRNIGQFSLETEPNKVFLTKSKEAIWQLKQTTDNTRFGNATPEGVLLIPGRGGTPPGVDFYYASYTLTNELLNAFESNDIRKTSWVKASALDPMNIPGQYYFTYKYKTLKVVGGPVTEFYTMLRLAELYLVRAEAAAHGAGNLTDAISDLNMLRRRAGLPDLSNDLTQTELVTAIAQERRVELFCEWGHRWLDLKRTGKATSVLSQMPIKQPWMGDYQLLYPIPPTEVQFGPGIEQNPGY